MYVAGNPVMLVDPDGREIIIWYMQDGKKTSFKFDGTNYALAPKNSYVQSVLKAYKYNVDNGGGGNLMSFAYSKDRYLSISYYYRNGNSYGNVYWNPYSALLTTDGHVLSPATLLEHEAAHAQHYTFLKNYWDRRKIKDDKYTNEEEKQTIIVDESWTATHNKEVPNGWVRPDHEGSPVGVVDPTSNKPDKQANEKLYEELNRETPYDWGPDKKKTDKYIKNDKKG